MILRLITGVLVVVGAAALGRRVRLPQHIGSEIRRRLNLAFCAFLAGYLLLAAVRLIASPPGLDQIATLVGVSTALGLLWLALRLALAWVHSR